MIISTGLIMTGHSNLAETPRDRFLKAARQELAEFERREQKFREVDRKERAEKFQLPHYSFKSFMNDR